MPDLQFDPSKTVTFDLANGLVHLDGTPARVLVPGDALLALARAAGPDAAYAFGHSLGETMGQRVAHRLGAPASVNAATVSVVMDHLSGEFALWGLGSLSLERWGRSLVIVLDQSPLGPEGDAMIGALLKGAIATATGRGVHVLVLDRAAVRARYLVGGPSGVERMRAWLAEGVPWGDALVRLHAVSEPVRGDA